MTSWLHRDSGRETNNCFWHATLVVFTVVLPFLQSVTLAPTIITTQSCRALLRIRRRQMTTGRWNSRNRITKEIREQILDAYLGDPIKGIELAISNGLTAAYANKLAYERGLLPTRNEKLLGRTHLARLSST